MEFFPYQKEPPTEVEPFQDLFPNKKEEIEASMPQTYERDLLKEVPSFVLLSPISRDNWEIMSRGPQVLDMKYREQD
jgi:hypothetical protein